MIITPIPVVIYIPKATPALPARRGPKGPPDLKGRVAPWDQEAKEAKKVIRAVPVPTAPEDRRDPKAPEAPREFAVT